MCGRIIQRSGPLRLAIVDAVEPLTPDLSERRARYNGAPGQNHLAIRQDAEGKRTLELLRWGLIPHWTKEANPKVRPINATAERVATAPMFRQAYAKRRCIVPIDGFFEWKAIKGQKAKQPYAIAMKDDTPFGVAGIWENWQNPVTGEWQRTFAIITTDANELVGQIHNRMPVILAPDDYDHWLALEPDPRDLLKPFPSDLMKIWPISTRVNSPQNDDAELLDPIE